MTSPSSEIFSGFNGPDDVMCVDVNIGSNCVECRISMSRALSGQEFATIGVYTPADLSNAAITVFGELYEKEAKDDDAKVTQRRESEAIASEIFNRYNDIQATGIKDLKAWERDTAEMAARARKMRGGEELENLRRKFDERNEKAKPIYLYLVNYKYSSNSLTHIVSAKYHKAQAQFDGYEDGRQLLIRLTSRVLKGEECRRQCQRWTASKAAVEKFARDPNALKQFIEKEGKFYYNRSNSSGTRKQKSGDHRIGGNDFFESA